MTWDKLSRAAVGIFASRLSTNVCTGLTLGVVAAHEIGHLLLGANNHSRRGIMRPHWNRKDLEDAYFGRQGFTPQQTMRV